MGSFSTLRIVDFIFEYRMVVDGVRAYTRVTPSPAGLTHVPGFDSTYLVPLNHSFCTLSKVTCPLFSATDAFASRARCTEQCIWEDVFFDTECNQNLVKRHFRSLDCSTIFQAYTVSRASPSASTDARDTHIRAFGQDDNLPTDYVFTVEPNFWPQGEDTYFILDGDLHTTTLVTAYMNRT